MTSNFFKFLTSNFSSEAFNSLSLIQDDQSYSYLDISSNVFSIYRHHLSNVSSEIIIVDGDLCFDSLCVILACFLRGVSFTIFVGLSVQEKSLRKQILLSKFPDFIEISSPLAAFPPTLSVETDTSITYLPPSCPSPSLFLFSSGSTGIPKLISVNSTSFLSLYNFPSSPPSSFKSRRYILSLLIDHIGGLNTFLSSLSSLSILVLPQSPSFTSLIDAMLSHSVTILPSTPSILKILSQDDRFNSNILSDLRLITYGTEKMPESLLQYLKSLFNRVKFLQTFGTSETGILPTLPSASSSKIRFRSLSDFKIENSMLYVRKLYSSSYNHLVDSQSSSDSTDWFATGDLAVLNIDSTVTILGRDKDVINVGGLKVSPNEIEEMAFTHSQILDCVSYPLSNPFTGNAVALRIVVKRSCTDTALVISELKHIFKSADKRKRPVFYKLVDSIEITSRGKKVRNFSN